MSDLIERQKALDALRNLSFEHVFQCGEYYGKDERQLTIINAGKAIDVIESLPSAEPEQQKGEWLPHPHEREWDVCSVCGTGCKRREFEMQFRQERFTEYGYQYCPHCGADMRISHE